MDLSLPIVIGIHISLISSIPMKGFDGTKVNYSAGNSGLLFTQIKNFL